MLVAHQMSLRTLHASDIAISRMPFDDLGLLQGGLASSPASCWKEVLFALPVLGSFSGVSGAVQHSLPPPAPPTSAILVNSASKLQQRETTSSWLFCAM